MVGWDHWPNGHEFEQASGDSEGQRGLACCSPWGCKELDTTEWLNNNNKKDLEILLLDVLTRLKTYVHTKPAHSFIHNFKIWKWPRGLSGGEWIHYYIISSTKIKRKKKTLKPLKDMEEIKIYSTKWNKSIQNGYIPHDSNYRTFWEKAKLWR